MFQHCLDIAVGVAGLAFLGGKRTDERIGDRSANGISVRIPTVETNRAEELGAHNRPSELRFRPTLRHGNPEVRNTSGSFLRMALREDPVSVEDDLGPLVIPNQRFALDVTRAVAKIGLSPVNNRPSKRRPFCRGNKPCQWHQARFALLVSRRAAISSDGSTAAEGFTDGRSAQRRSCRPFGVIPYRSNSGTAFPTSR